MPFEFSLPVLRIGHASVQAIIGWIFSIYTSWCIAEAIARKVDPLSREAPRTFLVLSLACLNNAAIGYAVEVAAGASGWWWWNISVKNPFTLDVPIAGVIAWYSVPFDFLLPFLVVLSVRGPKRWLGLGLAGLFVFHFQWAHGDLNLGYQLLRIPLFTTYHLLIIFANLLLPLLSRLQCRTGDEPSRAVVPRILVGLVIGVTVLMQVVLPADHDPALLVSEMPLVGLALIAFSRLPAWSIAVPSLLVGAALLPSEVGLAAALPLAYVLMLAVTFRSRGESWRTAHALGALFFVGLAYMFCAMGNGGEVQANRKFEIAKKQLQSGDLGSAEQSVREALDLCPHKDGFYLLLGSIQQRRGDLAAAADTYRALTEQIPGADLGYINLGKTLLRQAARHRRQEKIASLVRQAEAALRSALRIRPNHPEALLTLGQLLIRYRSSDVNAVAEAVSDLARASDLAAAEAGNPVAKEVTRASRIALAEHCLVSGQPGQARRWIEALAEVDPEDPRLGELRSRLGQLQKGE